MSQSHKKAIVRLHSTEALAGYISLGGLTDLDGGPVPGQVELLDLAGKVVMVPLAEVKWVCFIRDFNSGEMENPERLMKKTFAGRPRSAGVWLRLRLIDGDLIEGLAGNDVGLVSGPGLFLTPPDMRSNTQRMFLPRGSVKDLEIVMVIAPAGKRKPGATEAQAEPRGEVQESLFP
jgi:hypothetical protein